MSSNLLSGPAPPVIAKRCPQLPHVSSQAASSVRGSVSRLSRFTVGQSVPQLGLSLQPISDVTPLNTTPRLIDLVRSECNGVIARRIRSARWRQFALDRGKQFLDFGFPNAFNHASPHLTFVILSIFCKPLRAHKAHFIAVGDAARGPQHYPADRQKNDDRHGLNTALFSSCAFFRASTASSSSFFWRATSRCGASLASSRTASALAVRARLSRRVSATISLNDTG